jgi:hypothetical protein
LSVDYVKQLRQKENNDVGISAHTPGKITKISKQRFSAETVRSHADNPIPNIIPRSRDREIPTGALAVDVSVVKFNFPSCRNGSATNQLKILT